MEKKMDKLLRIQKASRRFRIFFTVIMVITPFIPVAILMFSNELPEPIRTQIFREVLVPFSAELSMTQRLLASTVSLIPSAVFVLGLYYLIRLFRLYEKGIIFMTENVTYYKKLGYILIISMFADIIRNSLMSMVLTLHNPPGQRMISLGYSSDDLTKLVMGLLIIVISWIMDIGKEIQEDQTYTI
jgi:hypothetical protein